MARTKAAKRGQQEAVKPVVRLYDSTGFVALDEGHAIIKACTDDMWSAFPHALMPVDKNIWEQIKMRGQPGPDYFVINDVPYVIGETAEHQKWEGRLEGASRYTRDYYGIMAAASFFRVFPKSKRTISVYATHAPEYINYRKDIKDSVIGEWKVECNGETRVYVVKDVYFADEPVAGAMNVILSNKGEEFQHVDLQQGTGLVLDIGGFTTDATLLENGSPDYMSIYSEPGVGIIRALEEFKKGVRTRYSVELKDSSAMRPEKLRDALVAGKYKAGGFGLLDCKKEADTACNRLVSLVSDIYKRFGGKSELDYVILTGGGSGVLFTRLVTALDHPRLYLAGKPEHVHMANVSGALKMMHFYKRFGAF